MDRYPLTPNALTQLWLAVPDKVAEELDFHDIDYSRGFRRTEDRHGLVVAVWTKEGHRIDVYFPNDGDITATETAFPDLLLPDPLA